MNRLLRAWRLLATGTDHDCTGFPWCPHCLPPLTATTPYEVRRSTVAVLRAHSADPFTRRCTCGAETTAYYDHVVEQLTNAGVLVTTETSQA